MDMTFKTLSHMELINLYSDFTRAYGKEHSLTLRVQEEIYCRMEGEGA